MQNLTWIPSPKKKHFTINTGQHDFTHCWTQPEKKQKYHPSWKFAGNLWGNVASIGSDKQCKMAWSIGNTSYHAGTTRNTALSDYLAPNSFLSVHAHFPTCQLSIHDLFRSLPWHLSSHSNLKRFCLKSELVSHANYTLCGTFEMSWHGETTCLPHCMPHLCYNWQG